MKTKQLTNGCLIWNEVNLEVYNKLSSCVLFIIIFVLCLINHATSAIESVSQSTSALFVVNFVLILHNWCCTKAYNLVLFIDTLKRQKTMIINTKYCKH